MVLFRYPRSLLVTSGSRRGFSAPTPDLGEGSGCGADPVDSPIAIQVDLDLGIFSKQL